MMTTGRVRRPSRRRRAMSMIEMMVALVIVGMLLGIAAVNFTDTTRSAANKASVTVLAAAVLDARAAAGVNRYRYSDTDTTLTSMDAVAQRRSTTLVQVEYTDAASQAPEGAQDALQVSVDSPAGLRVGLALMSSQQDNIGLCTLAVDSLRTGTQYARVAALPTATADCSGATALRCASTWVASAHDGTYADPYRLTGDETCLAH